MRFPGTTHGLLGHGSSIQNDAKRVPSWPRKSAGIVVACLAIVVGVKNGGMMRKKIIRQVAKGDLTRSAFFLMCGLWPVEMHD